MRPSRVLPVRPSVSLSVYPSVYYGLLAGKQKKAPGKNKVDVGTLKSRDHQNCGDWHHGTEQGQCDTKQRGWTWTSRDLTTRQK